MHLNNYHPIPSIPSRKNVFGYTENESNYTFLIFINIRNKLYKKYAKIYIIIMIY